jgi:CRISPR/Cas system CSM-associated protein Csm5 (group 7 of RAMP superfamily)
MDNLNQPVIIIKYSSYTESQKRAIKKYKEKNKEKCDEMNRASAKKYYEKNKEKMKQKALERYYKKKQTKLSV